MSLPDPGPWSPRRAVALLVAAGWIGSVLAAWVLLHMTFVDAAARRDSWEVQQRLDRVADVLDLRLRSIDARAVEAAAVPSVRAWVDAGASEAPEAVKVALARPEGMSFVGLLGPTGAWLHRDAAPDAPELGTPNNEGTRVVDAGGDRWVVGAHRSAGGWVVVAAPLWDLTPFAGHLGLKVSLTEGGDSLLRPTEVRVVGPEALQASRTLALPGGGTMSLVGVAGRPMAKAGLQTFRVLFVGFAVVLAGASLVVMRLLPRVLHRESDRLYSEFVDRTGEGIVLVEPDTLAILQANTAVATLLGRSSADLCALTLPEALPMSPAAVITLRGLLGKANVSLGEVPYADATRTRHIEITASQMTWRDAFVVCVVLRDVTARHAEAERNRHMAWHDPLTGLPTRAAFQERLRLAMTHARRRSEMLGVAFVDVDQFKSINDAVGHDMADRLLVDVASRLRDAVRGGDAVARQGGDEFLLLFTDLKAREDLAVLAERVLAGFRTPFTIEGREFTLTASVGLALFPDDGVEAADLVKHADVAMFQAKDAGRDGWQLYDGRMRARTANLADTRARLSHALERNELLLHFQPQVDLRTGRLIGAEALLRWMCDGRLVPPGEFIPLAEQTGLIAPIGSWVIAEACRHAKSWQDQGLPPVRVAVNLSARQFFNADVTHAVDRALAETGLAPEWLEVEITESLAMKNTETASRVLTQLRDRGVTVALDDFGTGYSSLAYLRQFPIDRLKLDRAFLAGATNDVEQRALVGAIIGLAHAIRMEVVAEGIETLEQLELLDRDGCDIGQGFGLSRPLAADAFTALLAEDAPLLERLRVSRVA